MSKAIKGFTVWLTGLSGAGKTTLARLLEKELSRNAFQVEVLDGDEVRRHVSKGLGFSREDREENIRRIGFLCQLLCRHGIVVIVAAISPYRKLREEIRAQSHGRLIEVYVERPIEVLIAQDEKGLYERALSGELKFFTGVSDPYEPPMCPEVVLHTDKETPGESLYKLVARLKELGYID
jgi:adenylyl-sulfate kinase